MATIRLIGLSVSACIRDIILGKVDESDVVAIVGGTDVRNDVRQVVDHYSRAKHSPWEKDPERARRIFMKLWDEGKIIQPRQLGLEPLFVGGGRHWAVQVDGVEMIRVIKLMKHMEDSDYGKTNQGS